MINLLKKFFGVNKEEEVQYIIVTINEKIGPIDRGEIYEDPLDDFLKKQAIGEITGGGTSQFTTGEIEYGNIEIELNHKEINSDKIAALIKQLESLGAPKGSYLTIEKTGEKLYFGKREGLAIYLDGVNLGQEVYTENDHNILIDELRKLTGDDSEIVHFWEGETETGLYFYAPSFDEMKTAIKHFADNHPLCKGARIEKIA